MADITGGSSSPAYNGHPEFYGALADSGHIVTPNAAPADSDYFDPFGGKQYDGEKTDTGSPMGQAKVGFHGVAGGHAGEAGGPGMPGYC